MILKFKELTSSLYQKGIKTYLSGRVHGNLETFYAHFLGWYMPDIFEITCKKHRLRPGIFIIEAFEATNFSIKKLVLNK